MLVRPILDVVVVWHPDDKAGAAVFERLHRHFHSDAYAGLAGGAVEVYSRSLGWDEAGGPPRPLLLPDDEDSVLQPARFVAVVPVLGVALRAAVETDAAWRRFVERVAGAASESVVVLPMREGALNLDGSVLARLLQHVQFLPADTQEAGGGDLERSVAQAVAQLAAGSESRIRVFVSHTKHSSEGESALGGAPIYEQVRSAIAGTKLADFFDAHDLQSGQDWAAVLDEMASDCALLMVRTDVYASREWTQREVLAAKRHDVPIVTLVALTDGESRGSFLMDHMPTVPMRANDPAGAIKASLNRLVDEAGPLGGAGSLRRRARIRLGARTRARTRDGGQLAGQAPQRGGQRPPPVDHPPRPAARPRRTTSHRRTLRPCRFRRSRRPPHPTDLRRTRRGADE